MRNKRIKILLSALLISVSMLGISPMYANASEWKQDSKGWWLSEENSYPRSSWRIVNDKWYYFGDDGYMKHDCHVDGYYLGSDGAWAEPSAQEKTSDPNKVLSSGLTLFEAGQQIKALVNNLQSMGESIDSNMDYINSRCAKLGTTYEEISKLPVDVMNQTASGGSYQFNSTGSNQANTNTPVAESKPQESASTGKVTASDVFGKGPAEHFSSGGTTAYDKDFADMIQNANK